MSICDVTNMYGGRQMVKVIDGADGNDNDDDDDDDET